MVRLICFLVSNGPRVRLKGIHKIYKGQLYHPGSLRWVVGSNISAEGQNKD